MNFVCTFCGTFAETYAQACPHCQKPNALRRPSPNQEAIESACSTDESLATAPKNEQLISGVSLFDDVLDGGLEKGFSVCLAATYGMGKSTLAMQALAGYATRYPDAPCAYISSEEQVKTLLAPRAKRLDAMRPNLFLVHTKSLASARAFVQREKIQIAVYDSLQEFGGLITQDYKTPETRIILSQLNAQGSVKGTTGNEHGGDAVVFASEIEVPENWNERNEQGLVIVPMTLRSVKYREHPTGQKLTYRLTEKGAVPYEMPTKKKKKEKTL